VAGYLVLEGGAEFGGHMAEPDRRAIELAGGLDAAICIIPTAAAPDSNHQRAGRDGQRWFQSLGARNVSVIPLIDRTSAEDPSVIATLRDAQLIYLLGGFTDYLGRTLRESPAWNAALEAYQSGAVIAGSSAGAMVLCEYYYQPRAGQTQPGLGLVPNACVLPHHDTFGHDWAPRLIDLLPDATLIGIDERTGMIDDAGDGRWSVYGQGVVALYRHGQATAFPSGASFDLVPSQ
jgi:cyanophycinase